MIAVALRLVLVLNQNTVDIGFVQIVSFKEVQEHPICLEKIQCFALFVILIQVCTMMLLSLVCKAVVNIGL